MIDFTQDKSDKLDRLDEIIRGNGKVGLRAEVKTMSEYIGVIKDNVKWMMRLIVGVFVLELLQALGMFPLG